MYGEAAIHLILVHLFTAVLLQRSTVAVLGLEMYRAVLARL